MDANHIPVQEYLRALNTPQAAYYAQAPAQATLTERLAKAGLKLINSGLEAIAGDAWAGEAKAAQLPKDLYDPRAPELSPDRYMSTIRQASSGEEVFVKYKFECLTLENGSKYCMKDPYLKRGVEFWQKLKENFTGQAKFITIDTSDWTPQERKVIIDNHIGSNDWPGFVLYKDGEIVKDRNGDTVNVKGPPKPEYLGDYIKWLREDVFSQTVTFK